jgi:hypothetical protein
MKHNIKMQKAGAEAEAELYATKSTPASDLGDRRIESHP